MPRCNGRGASDEMAIGEGSFERGCGIVPHKAQEPRRPSNAPGGTGGTAGCPEHQAPVHGRDFAGILAGSVWPVRSLSRGSISEECRPGSFDDVTRCEQAACASDAENAASTRSAVTPPDIEEIR